ncbi:sensor histidine kinase [Bacillus sp. FJAT-52991]|uniref:histidine kinase n=1 Tax=Bacillus kandeliae TaxID=3129297 RepID=A0ABZ2N6X5_9BACI
MRNKIYPSDQMEKYLLIDVIAIAFLFYYMVTTESIIGLTGNLLLFVVFLFAFYIALWHRDGRLLAACLLGFIVLTILGVLMDSWLLLYGGIFADLLGRSRSKRHIAVGMAAIVGMFFTVHGVVDGNPTAFLQTVELPIMMILLALPIVIFANEQAEHLKQELNDTNERLIQEEERHRIARDLHDTLGQTLTMIKLKSELTMRLMEKDVDQAKQELTDIRDTSRTALKQVREMVETMRWVSLEQELQYAEKALDAAGVNFEVNNKVLNISLSKLNETMTALSIREAVTNIMKHSQASSCQLTVTNEGSFVFLQLIDNGVGLKQISSGNGLSSMKERMKLISGQAVIEEGSNGGVVVTLKVPV